MKTSQLWIMKFFSLIILTLISLRHSSVLADMPRNQRHPEQGGGLTRQEIKDEIELRNAYCELINDNYRTPTNPNSQIKGCTSVEKQKYEYNLYHYQQRLEPRI